MMHSNILELIKITKKILPNCNLEIVSNGDFLNQEKIKELYKSGLDHLRVNNYVLKTTDKFLEIRKNLKIDPSIFIRERNKGKKNEFGLVHNNRAGAGNLKK